MSTFSNQHTCSLLLPFLTNSKSRVSSARLKSSGGTNLEQQEEKQIKSNHSKITKRGDIRLAQWLGKGKGRMEGR